MSGFDIITVFAIILCARLGIRLYTRYKKMKREEKEESSNREDHP
jgi:hypothetical protein